MIDTISSNVKLDLQLEKTRKQLKDITKKYKEVLGHIDYYQQQSFAALALSKTARKAPAVITSKTQSDKREATVIAGLSDIHIEAIVNKGEVNGLNRYNPEIAKARIQTFFERLISLTRKERQDIRISNLVLGLMGDLVENAFLHQESAMRCAMAPIEAALYADECITAGIEQLLAHGDFEQILLPCNVGNHGRAHGHKMWHGEIAYRDNYEYSVYVNLARKFANEPRIKFILPESYFTYTKVYNKWICWQHGHRFKGNQNNIDKYLLKLNAIRHADHYALAHFHKYFPHDDYTKNGSVIGTTPYSLENGYGHEEPKQFFRLLDNKLGFTISAPIFLEG